MKNIMILRRTYLLIALVLFVLMYQYSNEINLFFDSFNQTGFVLFDIVKFFMWLCLIALVSLPASIFDYITHKRIRFFKTKRKIIKERREKEFKDDVFGYKKINKILAPKKVQ